MANDVDNPPAGDSGIVLDSNGRNADLGRYLDMNQNLRYFADPGLRTETQCVFVPGHVGPGLFGPQYFPGGYVCNEVPGQIVPTPLPPIDPRNNNGCIRGVDVFCRPHGRGGKGY